MTTQRRSKASIPPLAVLALVLSGSLFRAVSSSCSPNDPSTNFSSGLSLPFVHAQPWSTLRAAIADGRFQDAEHILQLAQPSADKQFWNGVLLLHERRTFASIRALERAAHLKDTGRTETLLAVDYLLLNQRILAADAIGRALHLQPRDPMTLYLRGRLEFVSDNFKSSRRDFSAVVAEEPDDYRTLYYLAVSEWRLGDNVSARNDLRRAVDVLGCHRLNFPLAPYTLAQVELDLGKATEALKAAQLALTMAEAEPASQRDTEETAKILVERGNIEDRLGRSQKAEDDLERAVKLDPYLAEGWYLLAHVCRQRGKAADATRALKQFQQLRSEL